MFLSTMAGLCDVFLYYHEMAPFSGARIKASSFGGDCRKHWIVSFLYDNGSVICCDGYRDSLTGRLYGRFSQMHERDIEETREKMLLLGHHLIFGEEVKCKVKEMNFHQGSDADNRNCQHWARDFLSALDIPVDDSQFSKAMERSKPATSCTLDNLRGWCMTLCERFGDPILSDILLNTST